MTKLCRLKVKVMKELLLKERIHSLGEQIFPKRSSNLKRDIIVENQCLIQKAPFDHDVCNFFSILATPLQKFRSCHFKASC